MATGYYFGWDDRTTCGGTIPQERTEREITLAQIDNVTMNADDFLTSIEG